MKVADICTREVVAADRLTSVREAAALMRERHVGALVVLADSAQGARVIGIVTDRDLVIEALARGLFGILTLDDLLDAMAHEVSEVADVVRGGIAREVAEREPLRAGRPVAAVIPEYSFE